MELLSDSVITSLMWERPSSISVIVKFRELGMNSVNLFSTSFEKSPHLAFRKSKRCSSASVPNRGITPPYNSKVKERARWSLSYGSVWALPPTPFSRFSLASERHISRKDCAGLKVGNAGVISLSL